MSNMIRVVTPLLLHMILSETVAAVFGSTWDSALCTTAAAVLVLPAAVWMFWRDQSEKGMPVKAGRPEERNLRSMHGLLYAAGCFFLGGFLNLLISRLMFWTGISQVFSNETQEQLLAGGVAVQVLGLGFLIPLTEELVFRGLIYSRMKSFLPVKVSVVLSASLFAVYHGNPIQIIFAFPMALVLTILFEKGRLLRYPVLFHMGANLTAVLFQLLSQAA